MKGQKLFVRPLEPADQPLVAQFLAVHAPAVQPPVCGVLGKLVGNLVAVAAMSITSDAITIDELVVAPELRRKRVGRVMIDEIDQLAAKLQKTQLVVNDAREARGFFERLGFTADSSDAERNAMSRVVTVRRETT